MNRNLILVLSILLSFAIATVFLTRPQASALRLSPAAGLMTLHTLSQNAVPYPEAMNSAKPTLIEFYADWCTVCQSMAGTMQALHQSFGHDINFVMINVDDLRWYPQVQQYHATGVPQFTLLNPDHSVLETWVGKVPKAILSQQLQALMT